MILFEGWTASAYLACSLVRLERLEEADRPRSLGQGIDPSLTHQQPGTRSAKGKSGLVNIDDISNSMQGLFLLGVGCGGSCGVTPRQPAITAAFEIRGMASVPGTK